MVAAGWAIAVAMGLVAIFGISAVILEIRSHEQVHQILMKAAAILIGLIGSVGALVAVIELST